MLLALLVFEKSLYTRVWCLFQITSSNLLPCNNCMIELWARFASKWGGTAHSFLYFVIHNTTLLYTKQHGTMASVYILIYIIYIIYMYHIHYTLLVSADYYRSHYTVVMYITQATDLIIEQS